MLFGKTAVPPCEARPFHCRAVRHHRGVVAALAFVPSPGDPVVIPYLGRQAAGAVPSEEGRGGTDAALRRILADP